METVPPPTELIEVEIGEFHQSPVVVTKAWYGKCEPDLENILQ